MAVSVAEILRRWRSIDILSESKDVIGETSDDIIHLNQEQLLHGEGSDGNGLPYYASYEVDGEQYGEIKERENPNNGGRYDMRFSGESFNTMAVSLQGEKMTIKSNGEAQNYEDGGYDKLHRIKVKGRIFGLNNDNQKAYRNKVLVPKLAIKIAELTGAKIKRI